MAEQSPTTLVGCLVDVSKSMRKALQFRPLDEAPTERLYAVLRAALRLAQAELRSDRCGYIFVGAFGMNTYQNCTAVIDLCSAVAALLDSSKRGKTGHELLIQTANENDLPHVAKYIRTKLSDDEARLLHAYLRRHPDCVKDFVNVIPSESCGLGE